MTQFINKFNWFLNINYTCFIQKKAIINQIKDTL